MKTVQLTDKIRFIHGDCMDVLRESKENQYDLAVVDPPYGIGASEMQMGRGKKNWSRGKKWDDEVPSSDYFHALKKCSENQIIWGGNHFDLPKTRSWLFWDKDVREGLSFSSGELAWTSFDIPLRKIFMPYSGFRGKEDEKIHPTQKPIALYKWIYEKYATPEMHIIDTHLGSASSAIAAYYFGCEFTGIELDEEYFEASIKRFREHIAKFPISRSTEPSATPNLFDLI